MSSALTTEADGEPRLRADARRNRERLLAVARDAFAVGDDPPLDAIAREAGVGIGTLYRHFPTREALVETAYRAELAALGDRAEALLAEHPPEVALRRWMDDYAGFVATKRGMADTLRALVSDGALASARTRDTVVAAVARLLEAGARAGTLRADADADDVVTLLVGMFVAVDGGAGAPADTTRRARLLDLVAAGLRP